MVGDPSGICRRREAARRELSHLLGAARDTNEHMVEDGLLEAVGKPPAKLVGLEEEGRRTVVDARRQLNGEPPVIDSPEIRWQRAERRRNGIDHVDDVTRGRSRRRLLVGASQARSEEKRRDRQDPEPAQERSSHQCGTCNSRWIVEPVLSRVMK
jgi:hypothetical protein